MTDPRHESYQNFLDSTGWFGSKQSALAGDASARRYVRLTHPKTGQTAMLMDAPPAVAGSMEPFVSVANYLRSLDLSAPEIIAADLSEGFLLLEDLGDAIFASAIKRDPSLEPILMNTAIDVIAVLHANPNPDLPVYGANTMAQSIDVTLDQYCNPHVKEGGATLIALLADKLGALSGYGAVSLRDFHAENLIWLPDREGVQRIGLLDFQDAVQTHMSYDLASLTRDARRDVPSSICRALEARLADILNLDLDMLLAQTALVAVQRNLRILGIFARLSRTHGKQRYIDLIPRVWSQMQADLSLGELSDLRIAVNQILPDPSPEYLQKLRHA